MELSALALFDDSDNEKEEYTIYDPFAEVEPVDVNEPMDILYLEFKKTTSKFYRKAVRLAEQLPGYTFDGAVHSCNIDTVLACLMNLDEITQLVTIINKWKNTKYILLGTDEGNRLNLHYLYGYLEKAGGKYGAIAKNWQRVSHGAITIEPLPLKVVYYPGYYGAFFAFAEDIGGELFFCECERKAITNYFHSSIIHAPKKGIFPPALYQQAKEQGKSKEEVIRYKPNLCFKCNRVTPKKLYCDPVYGGNFKQHYGWYINQEYYLLGLNNFRLTDIDSITEELSPDIYDEIKRLAEYDSHSGKNYISDDNLNRILENSVREKMGYRRIGEGWVSETILFHIVESLYPNEEIVRHYRPEWLDGLELDIYIPNKKIAFEYQGLQHFKAVDHWGGEKQLKKQKDHDARKKMICENLGIELFCVDYDEPLDSDYIKKKIESKCSVDK